MVSRCAAWRRPRGESACSYPSQASWEASTRDTLSLVSAGTSRQTSPDSESFSGKNGPARGRRRRVGGVNGGRRRAGDRLRGGALLVSGRLLGIVVVGGSAARGSWFRGVLYTCV